MKFEKVGFIVAALLFAGIAQAQTWNSNTVQWDAPTACDTGDPVSACPVQTYRVERSNSPTGSFTTLATVAGNVLTYTHTNAVAGQNCYRVLSVGSNGASGPSTPACRTNTSPTPIPNPPTNTRVVSVVAGLDHVPVFTVLANGTRSSTVAGFTSAGSNCTGPVLFTYRGVSWRKPVQWVPWQTPATASVAAPCA
jgi:hypothetical protein